MYAAEVLTVPPLPFVIFTQVDPAVPAGVIAAIWVASVTLTPVAGVPPIVTPSELPATKSDPVIVTAVPPSVVPDAGEMLVKTGGAI